MKTGKKIPKLKTRPIPAIQGIIAENKIDEPRPVTILIVSCLRYIKCTHTFKSFTIGTSLRNRRFTSQARRTRHFVRIKKRLLCRLCKHSQCSVVLSAITVAKRSVVVLVVAA